MLLGKEKLQHLNTVVNEGKVVVIATDADGKIWYTIKQDGFEDSYLNAKLPRTGWEEWKSLELPNEVGEDKSVIEREKAELTYQQNPEKYFLRSLYKTQEKSAVAPVQIISALGHIYVFRQSTSNTLLVDRFVLDGRTNQLNRKLEVRFKRSKQKHTPTKEMNKGASGLVNIDSLDFCDADGKFFYEPTTELCLVDNLENGWFAVVLVPTIENDVSRWHIFAYNSQSKTVELTTIRTSAEGLFDLKDYTIFEESNETLVPRQIPGVIKRTLNIDGVTITNGLAATKYDLQQEQQTQSGEKQLLKTATRLMLAIPTDKGTAAFSFSIAPDGTLAEIDQNPKSTVIRSQQQQILLPLNTLDEIKAIGDITPPPQGMIKGLAGGTTAEDIENLVKISTNGKAGELNDGDLVKITGTNNYQGFHHTKKVDNDTFEIDVSSSNGLGNWEKEEKEADGLIFDGIITAYEQTADGKLKVICPNHGLEDGDKVQISGTDIYDSTYPVRKIDDTNFVIERKWAKKEAINVKLASQKRRGVVFDGQDDYVEIPYSAALNPNQFTVSCWVKAEGGNGQYQSVLTSRGENPLQGYIIYITPDNKCGVFVGNKDRGWTPCIGTDITPQVWTHIAGTFDDSKLTFYINGQKVQEVNTAYVVNTNCPLRIGAGATEGYPRYFFAGQISEVQVWKNARSAEEIKNSMYLPLTGKEVGLVGYWRLGGISEGQIIDFSVNGNNGKVYGDPYVSAATLNRKLAGGNNAVKYSNPELFAVSGRATYEESFEFKVNSQQPIDLAYLNNADENNNKIFTLSYWGKTSRSAEKIIPIDFAQNVKQNPFNKLGQGWYSVSCQILMPDGVNMLRSFEIDNIKGDWESIEIRKQRIRLLSDSITEAKYIDTVTLKPLANSQVALALSTTLAQLDFKEKQLVYVIKEKAQLELYINNLKSLESLDKTNAIEKKGLEISNQELKISLLKGEIEKLDAECRVEQLENENPLNFWCKIVCRGRLDSLQVHATELYFDNNGNTENEFKFVPTNNGYYRIVSKVSGQALCFDKQFWQICFKTDTDPIYMYEWKPKKLPSGDYLIEMRLWADYVLIQGNEERYIISVKSKDNPLWENWGIIAFGKQINNIGNNAFDLRNFKNADLKEAIRECDTLKTELADLQLDSKEQGKKKAKLEDDLNSIKKNIAKIEQDLNGLNSSFISGVKNTRQTPQAMPEVAKDDKGLVTQGALLSFVNSASRLNAIETCEGNVQLSYFDTQGQMRQTNYDVTADSKNTAFEQWIPDLQRACLNFDTNSSVVKLDRTVYLPSDWSIEAWFSYPLPVTGEWNTLIRGKDADHHILVKEDSQQLGIYINSELGQDFYSCGFDMKLLSPGWHHITAVGKGDTTLFYIDGEKVGDTKKEVKEDQKTKPKDEKRETKIKDAILKATSPVHGIGNNSKGNNQQFGKVAEVRIWGIALSEEEIAVNSKTLLSGNEPGLLAYYPLNEADGIEIRDISGNGNNGIVSGANWWGCNAPIGNPGDTVMQFDGVNDYISTPLKNLSGNAITIEYWFKGSSLQSAVRQQKGDSQYIVSGWSGKHIFFLDGGGNGISVGSQAIDGNWHHIAMTWQKGTRDGFLSYLDGNLVDHRDSANVEIPNLDANVYIGSCNGSTEFTNGQIADVRIWNKARTQAEIQADMYKRVSGKEPNLVAYYPLNEIKLEGTTKKVTDLVGNNHGTVTEAVIVNDNSLPIAKDTLVSSEYSSVTLDRNKRKVAIMRRFFAYSAANGATLLPDKRIEALELKWIGNAQFAPTLLGYIEGAPPVPSENLTLSDDYNGATSVELTMSEDVAFSWKRSQDGGVGAGFKSFVGADVQLSMGVGIFSGNALSFRAGVASNFDSRFQFQNESSITSSSSLSMTDKLELRGTPEQTPKFYHLGKRFIPKNIGYALVVSALADVFIARLARSGKMVEYKVQPVDGISPDVNTITFLMNPAYTMNGSLDGMTGSSATSDRFFKHVPEMRSQYGSLYPASYYRLQEAYNLKQQIEAEDKRRESYFVNFNALLVDEASLNRETYDRGKATESIEMPREKDKSIPQQTDEQKKEAKIKQLDNDKEEAAKRQEAKQKEATKTQAEIDSKIAGQDPKAHATNSFAGWQRRMEDLQVWAGKRNIVNTYVWDADGGLRTEAQSFASTVEHTIGGSFVMSAGVGMEGKLVVMGNAVELSAQATMNLTQTMSKTESRGKGFQLNVDLGGLESKGITNYDDYPILPGEKVDRYRFMSFYLEGTTQHFNDFFNYVVDPEWLASNGEEARALRTVQAGKPNKTWRVLHRVTYVERPALRGFGADVRKLPPADQKNELTQLQAKIDKLEKQNQEMLNQLSEVFNLLKSQNKA